MFDTYASRVFVAIGVAAGAVGLGFDIASWGWAAAPALLLPAGLCVAGAVVYFRGRSRELQHDDASDRPNR